ncbi:MAG: hypothetical protein ACTS45_00895, partial [Candidatus Hodgkinia cicadicola]
GTSPTVRMNPQPAEVRPMAGWGEYLQSERFIWMKSQSDFGGFHPPFGTRIAQTKVVEIAIRRSTLGGWNNEVILLMLRGNRGD